MIATTTTGEVPGFHVCPVCALPLLQPTDWAVARAERWWISFECPSCDFVGDELLSPSELRSLAAALAQGSLELSACLAQLSALNMRAYARRFTAALAAGEILPDDF
jgi:hypothetical protein